MGILPDGGARRPRRRPKCASEGKRKGSNAVAKRIIEGAAVQAEIKREIEPKAWARCVTVNKAEQASLRHVLDQWKASR